MEIIHKTETGYERLISKYIHSHFPSVVKSTFDTMEVLFDVLVGTKQLRYGSVPSIEHSAYMRQIITNHVTLNRPIKVLIPWGGVKANGDAHVDIAEVSALKQLQQVVEDVQKIYSPGLSITFRIEDASAEVLFKNDAHITAISIDQYSESFASLVGLMLPEAIVYRESHHITADKFMEQVEHYAPIFEAYLEDTHDIEIFDFTLTDLYKLGWSGTIPKEQRDYYYNTYEKLYGDTSIEVKRKRLAVYLASALVRKHQNLSGISPSPEKHLQITFVKPIPGIGDYHANVLYYRSIPFSCGRTSIAPWRAKGYLQINGDHITPKLTDFNNEIISELVPAEITILDDTCDKFTIKTDCYEA